MVVAVGSFIAAAIFLWKSRTHSARLSLIRRAVPLKATEIGNAFPGQVVAVRGNAGTDAPLTSLQSETPCVYFDYEVIRRYTTLRRRGNNQGRSRSRRVSGAETVAQETKWTPFRVQDDSGQISVNPDGAWFEGVSVMDRVEPATDKNKNGLRGQTMNLSKGEGITTEYSINENAIKIGQPVYVVGPVNDHGQIEGNGRHGVIISYRPESDLGSEWTSHSRKRLYGCFGAFALSILALVGGTVATAMSLI